MRQFPHTEALISCLLSVDSKTFITFHLGGGRKLPHTHSSQIQAGYSALAFIRSLCVDFLGTGDPGNAKVRRVEASYCPLEAQGLVRG